MANSNTSTSQVKLPRALDNGTAPDPFDVEALRLSQDFNAGLGVKKALLTVPVRKPSKEWFVRSHPDEDYRLQTGLLELKDQKDRALYLVAPTLWPMLAGESTFAPRALFIAVNRQGVVFLWPVRLPSSDGRHDEWSRSALEAASEARERWVRVQANMSLGAYEVYTAAGEIPEPDWAELLSGKSFQDLLKIAFRDNYIQSEDHPVLQDLRGV